MCGCQSAAGRLDTALGGGYSGGLLVGLHFGLEPLHFGSCARLGEPCVRIPVEFRKSQRRLLLHEVCLGRCQVRLRLPDAALRVHRRLSCLQLILVELFLQHCNLILRALHFCLRVGERGPCLIFFRAHLGVVEPRDYLACRHRVAFAHSDLENFSARFWGDRGIVAFNATTERHNAGR